MFSDLKESEETTQSLSLVSPVSEDTDTAPRSFTKTSSLPRGHTDLLLPGVEKTELRNGRPLPKHHGKVDSPCARVPHPLHPYA